MREEIFSLPKGFMQELLEWEPDRWHDHINYSCLAAEVRQALRKHIDYWAKVQGPGIRKSLVSHYFQGLAILSARHPDKCWLQKFSLTKL